MSDKPHVIRFLIPLAAFVLIGIVFAVGVKHSPDVGVIHSPLIGKHAPAWSLPVLDGSGQTFGSKDLQGRWYVLNIWGTWCEPCHEEHPELVAIARDASVPIIGIDWNDDDALANDFLTKQGNPYQVVTTDHDGHVAIDWGVYGTPETFLVSPSGEVVYKNIGPMTPQIWRKEFLSRLPPQLTEHPS